MWRLIQVSYDPLALSTLKALVSAVTCANGIFKMFCRFRNAMPAFPSCCGRGTRAGRTYIAERAEVLTSRPLTVGDWCWRLRRRRSETFPAGQRGPGGRADLDRYRQDRGATRTRTGHHVGFRTLILTQRTTSGHSFERRNG